MSKRRTKYTLCWVTEETLIEKGYRDLDGYAQESKSSYELHITLEKQDQRLHEDYEDPTDTWWEKIQPWEKDEYPESKDITIEEFKSLLSAEELASIPTTPSYGGGSISKYI